MSARAKKRTLVIAVAALALAAGVGAAADGGGGLNPPDVLIQEQADQIPRGKLAYPDPAAGRSTIHAPGAHGR
jgi:hypothetical protein